MYVVFIYICILFMYVCMYYTANRYVRYNAIHPSPIASTLTHTACRFFLEVGLLNSNAYNNIAYYQVLPQR